jgi:hypothetical protein
MPEQPRRIFCFPVEVPSKYFPLVLYVFFCLFSGPQLDFAGQLVLREYFVSYSHVLIVTFLSITVAMGVGYLHAKKKLDFITPSTLTIQNMEQNGIFTSLSR